MTLTVARSRGSVGHHCCQKCKVDDLSLYPLSFSVGGTAPEWFEFGMGLNAWVSETVSLGAGYSGIEGGRALSNGAWTGTVRVSL